MNKERRVEILFEEMKGMYKTIWEGLQGLREELKNDIKNLKEELKEDNRLLQLSIKELKERLERVERDIFILKGDVSQIKEMLKTVTTKGDLIVIERRIERLEAVVF
ncbi:MAG: hypothetical protein ABIF11_02240 [Nitrospirota bacterium]